MAQTKVLFTGATGYIGGSVLAALTTSQNPAIKNGTKVTALVRKQEQAQVLERAGINALLFNGLDAIAQMESLVRDHVVIHTASTLHTETIEAMIAGLGARKKDTGREVFFIHTAGTGSIADRPITGSYISEADHILSDKTDNIYSYFKTRQSTETSPSAAATSPSSKKGLALNVPTYILMSPLIYGIDTGLFNKQSIQIPAMIRGALQAGRAEVIGDGSQRWGNVHVGDLGRLYELAVGGWRRVVFWVGRGGFSLLLLGSIGGWMLRRGLGGLDVRLEFWRVRRWGLFRWRMRLGSGWVGIRCLQRLCLLRT